MAYDAGRAAWDQLEYWRREGLTTSDMARALGRHPPNGGTPLTRMCAIHNMLVEHYYTMTAENDDRLVDDQTAQQDAVRGMNRAAEPPVDVIDLRDRLNAVIRQDLPGERKKRNVGNTRRGNWQS